MGRALPWVAGAAASAVLGCTLLTSFDGLTGGAGDAGVDAQSDVVGVDAGVSGAADSASDVALDVSDAGPFCARLSPKPLYCRDFDDGTPADMGWTLLTRDVDAGALAIDLASPAPSSPGSLLVGNNGISGPCNNCTIRNLMCMVFSRPLNTSAHFAVDVRVDSIGTSDDGVVFGFGASTPGNGVPGYFLDLLIRKSSATAAEEIY